MTIKMVINSQLSTMESKKQSKEKSRIEIELSIWRSFGWLSVDRGKGEILGKGTGVKKYKLVGTK